MNDKKYDPNNPYAHGGIETMEYLRAKLTEEQTIGFWRGNVLKYVSRAGIKTPNPLEDYKKALWYLKELVAHYESK